MGAQAPIFGGNSSMKKEVVALTVRALVDIPAHGLKAGDYGSLPADVAQSYVDAGAFDIQAKQS